MKLTKVLSLATIACLGMVASATAGEIKLTDAEMKKSNSSIF